MRASVCIVKDYLCTGEFIVGIECELDKFMLDDGDCYPKDFLVRNYDVVFIPSEDIIEAFKARFNREKVRRGS